MIGVKPSDTYKFMIILSPTGPYYAAPMRIYVEEKYTRAAPGGIGFAKAAGNYAASIWQQQKPKKKDMTRFYGRMLLNTNMCRRLVP